MCTEFNAQCLAGHVWVLPKDSELEKKAKERIENGFLDAILVGEKECSDCQHCNEVRDRENSLYLDW